MRSHRFLEDIALADAAFEARGDTPEELLLASADALFETMADRSSIEVREERHIQISGTDLSDLLFQWLGEIIYLKDAEQLLFTRAEVTLQRNHHWTLRGRLIGEVIHDGHRLGSDVKAVTKHMYEVGQQDGQWVCRVVLDI